MISLYKKGKKVLSIEVFSVFYNVIENLVNSVSIANTTLDERDVHETTELRPWQQAAGI